jgi:hypothetical protein
MDKIKKKDIQIDKKLFYKMIFLYNSLNNGWMIKKQNEEYIFTKPHENKKEVLEDTYLLKFMKTNLDLNKIIS